ncbi:hypothetical protein BKP64_02060 [Marinobacter salinus]|uniref:LPS-assembly lipoprotein LptE n=1 Tax=Marinobacter salinus TaxID=1874317 RepID=A0A1D9GHE8_9GAMM|nr:LPS assembly lipoprotein LptE [Marinobacter salinus]AOY87062.1 hypothetical protein BKP64_02060 [Marinobacter salinus]
MNCRSGLKAARYPALGTALAVLLAGCGFQLRGAPPVSSALQPLAVMCSAQVPTSLCQSLRNQLDLGGVDLRPPSDAAFVLRLSGFKQDRRATAITVQAAAAEYTLLHTVGMELVSSNGIPMIADTRLTASESYRYDETNVLAKQREEEELRIQLGDRLAQQIIFRLAPLTEARIQVIRDQYEEAKNQAEEQPATP